MKKWMREHQKELANFGIFAAMALFLVGGVLYYSFATPPIEAEAARETASTQEQEEDREKGTAKETQKTGDQDKEKEEKADQEKKVEETKESGQKEEAQEEKKEETAVEKQEEKGTESTEIQPEAQQTETSQAETNQTASKPASKPQTNSSSAQETPAQSQPSQTEQPAQKEPVWHEPVYENRWIVDQAAWDETVSEPIYEQVERCICNGCGTDITNNIDAHLESQMLAGNMACSGYHSEWQTIQTGTNSYVVHHDEVGHWEQVLVQEGYWE